MTGAEKVVGVEVDEQALALAKENSDRAGVEVEWVQSDIEKINSRFDVVIMNPPYGTRTAHADTRFRSAPLLRASADACGSSTPFAVAPLIRIATM